MSETADRIDTVAVAEKWLQQCGPCDGGLPMGCTHPDEDYRPVMAAIVEELERTRRGAKTLGHIVEQQGRMILDITGCHDFIGEDGDGDWGAVWENAYDLLPRVKAAEGARDRAEQQHERQESAIEALGNLAAEHLNCSGCPTPWWLTNWLQAECASRVIPPASTADGDA